MMHAFIKTSKTVTRITACIDEACERGTNLGGFARSFATGQRNKRRQMQQVQRERDVTRFVIAIAGAAVLALGSGSALAASSTLDFSALDYTSATTRANTALQHGDVISNEAGAGPQDGFLDKQFTLTNGVQVGVSARVKGSSDDRSVIFDSKNTTTDEDTDLEVRNFSGDGTSTPGTRAYSNTLQHRYVNTGGVDDPYNSPGEVGNILILQEYDSGCGASGSSVTGGRCSSPDDDASSPSGFFYFEFSQDVIVDSIDFVDIEVGEEAMVWFFDEANAAMIDQESDLNALEANINDLGTYLEGIGITGLDHSYTAYGTTQGGDSEGDTRFADASDNFSSTSNATYDTKWSQMVFGPTSGTRGMLIKLGGSGGISDIRLSTPNGGCTVNCGGGTDVPEPATLLLMGSGLAGLMVADRRRRRRKQAAEETVAEAN